MSMPPSPPVNTNAMPVIVGLGSRTECGFSLVQNSAGRLIVAAN